MLLVLGAGVGRLALEEVASSAVGVDVTFQRELVTGFQFNVPSPAGTEVERGGCQGSSTGVRCSASEVGTLDSAVVVLGGSTASLDRRPVGVPVWQGVSASAVFKADCVSVSTEPVRVANSGWVRGLRYRTKLDSPQWSFAAASTSRSVGVAQAPYSLQWAATSPTCSVRVAGSLSRCAGSTNICIVIHATYSTRFIPVHMDFRANWYAASTQRRNQFGGGQLVTIAWCALNSNLTLHW